MQSQRTVKRVLIYRLGSLGDTVVAMPAFHLIARAYPDADRRLLTSFPPNAKAPSPSAVLEHTGLVHGYFRYVLRTRNPFELIRLWWQILAWRPQVVVDVSPASGVSCARRNSIFFRLCGISRLVAVPVTEEMQVFRPDVSSEGGPNAVKQVIFERECSRLVRNLAELGNVDLNEPASWDLKLTLAEHTRATELLLPVAGRPFFAVSFGTKNQANDWERENWKALLARLADLYPTHCLVVCGATAERADSEVRVQGWRERSSNPALNLCGLPTPRESAAIFMKAALFLGHDSGPMHLAAAVQTRCVAVFSARNLPGIWYPYGKHHRVIFHRVDCEGCRLESCTVQKKKCIMSITVDEVLAHVLAATNDD